MIVGRPEPDEYASFYAGYIERVSGADPVETLSDQLQLVRGLAAVPPERETHRYAEGKWSVREVVGHLADGERVFGYRAFRFGRGDATALAGFEEDAYVAGSHYHATPLPRLIAELVHLRESNLALFAGLAEDDWRRTGIANDSPVSVRALAFMIAGHTGHHLGVLRERYGVGG